MHAKCNRHSFIEADDCCRNCGYDFCSECLVYAFGPKKPPYCVSCALAAAGVRSNAANAPTMSKKAIRARQKELRKHKRRERHASTVEVSADAATDSGSDFEWDAPVEEPQASGDYDRGSSDFDWADSSSASEHAVTY